MMNSQDAHLVRSQHEYYRPSPPGAKPRVAVRPSLTPGGSLPVPHTSNSSSSLALASGFSLRLTAQLLFRASGIHVPWIASYKRTNRQFLEDLEPIGAQDWLVEQGVL